MITVAEISAPPTCIGNSFIVRAIARDQSDPCKGCALHYMGFRCQCECENTLSSCDMKRNIKKVKHGDVVCDRQGNTYLVYQPSDFRMEFVPCSSK